MTAYTKLVRAGSAAVVFAIACAGSLAACSSDSFDSTPNGTGGADQDGGGGAAGNASGGASGSGGLAGAETGGTAGQGGAAGTKGSADNGTTCGDGSECKSGFCVDSVCCDGACDKDCESCAVTGSEGTCTPFDKGTDPDAECLGSAQAGDTCAGSCDGASACEFPGATTSCGNPVCTGSQSTGFACDGTGECKMATADCAPYMCGASACKTSCTGDTDCVSGNYCSAGKCVTKKANGQACNGNNQCSSSNCVSGTCCNVSSCGSPFSCSDGTCKCGGSVCAAGDSCVLWYKDADGDKFGDPNPNLSIYGCATKPPPGYAANNADCYDANANAHPGQTGFFPDHRGDLSFDYDCDGKVTKKIPKVDINACRDCGTFIPGTCWNCGNGPIPGGLNTYGFGCNGNSNCSSSGPATGFASDVACGTAAKLSKCGPDSTTSCSFGKLTEDPLLTKQTCR